MELGSQRRLSIRSSVLSSCVRPNSWNDQVHSEREEEEEEEEEGPQMFLFKRSWLAAAKTAVVVYRVCLCVCGFVCGWVGVRGGGCTLVCFKDTPATICTSERRALKRCDAFTIQIDLSLSLALALSLP